MLFEAKISTLSLWSDDSKSNETGRQAAASGKSKKCATAPLAGRKERCRAW